MPPKKAKVHPLTEPEEMLLIVAARISAAIRYKEANPNGGYGHYLANLAEEMVRESVWFPSCFPALT
jgi:hypothetical protein